MPVQCRKCGDSVDHVCTPSLVVGSVVQDCPLKKGAIWVQVKAGGADVRGAGVRVKNFASSDVVRSDPVTDATGFVGYDPLDSDKYLVELLSIPSPLDVRFGLPIPAASPATVTNGEITFLSFALAPRVHPDIVLPRPAVAVGGPRAALTLKAEPPFEGKGKGVLTVTKGAANIKLHAKGGSELTLTSGAVTFDSVPAGGLELEIEGVTASDAAEGVALTWKLESTEVPVGSDAKAAALTVVEAKLAVETKGGVLAPSKQRGEGAVVHVQDKDGKRARLKITATCAPADFKGTLALTLVGTAGKVFDAASGGKEVDLGAPVAFAKDLPPYFFEGTAASKALTDTGMKLAITDLAPAADEVKVTVIKTELRVFGGLPGTSDPSVALDDTAKYEPGRRLYLQKKTTYPWPRAKLQLLKTPADAPCTLELRASGDGGIDLFPETTAGSSPVSLETHVDGETALTLPLKLAADAIKDASAGLAYWADGATETGASKRLHLHVELAGVDDDCDRVTFRVLKPLAEFDRIVVIDMGGPGSGHQAGALKFLGSVAEVGYAGDVVLLYNRRKTRIFASGLGKKADLDDPALSYALYFGDWDGVVGGMTVRCKPLNNLNYKLTTQLGRIFTNLQTYWTQYAWPGAKAPAPTTAPTDADGKEKARWTVGNPNLKKLQDNFRATITKDELAADLVQRADLPVLSPTVTRTLTAFGAMDVFPDTEPEAQDPDLMKKYFPKYWIPLIRTMTGETSPTSLVFQPFLWETGHPIQTRKGTDEPIDLVAKINAAGGKTAYRYSPPPPSGDGAIIDKLPAVAKSVLTRAKAGDVHLISSYYGRPVSDIEHIEFLRAMVAVIKRKTDLTKPVVVALIGDDGEGDPAKVAAETTDGTVIARTDGSVAGLDVDIELAHIGRTTAMAQFQRYSCLFVTEGANTWQELLAMGKPSLSVKPTGNTQPWTQAQPSAPAAANMVKTASEALVAKPRGSGHVDTLAAYLTAALDTSSTLNAYFKEWERLLAHPASDQVLMGIKYLPDPV